MSPGCEEQKHTAVIVNPGHFHAALTLRRRHTRLNDDVYVFAEDGPELEKFTTIVDSFNNRPNDPTQWSLHMYRGDDYLDALLARKPGDLAIVAGKNDTKMATIHRLHQAGFHVLGDKPWLINPEMLPLLDDVLAAPPLAGDIMTERNEVGTRLQKALISSRDFFGEFAGDGERPAIEMKSVHHLYKTVNGVPLQRPPWYFDSAVQGEGMFDVTTHLVDLAFGLTNAGGVAADEQIVLHAARQWSVSVSPELFAKATGHTDFPPALGQKCDNGALHYPCNAYLGYALGGVSIDLEATWDLIEPEGGGDIHDVIARGTRANVSVVFGPETGFATAVFVDDHASSPRFEANLEALVAELQTTFAGLAYERVDPGHRRWRFIIPDALRTTHEQHFAMVLDRFLSAADRNLSGRATDPTLSRKYRLLAEAAIMAARSHA